jgi:hypothetical protein
MHATAKVKTQGHVCIRVRGETGLNLGENSEYPDAFCNASMQMPKQHFYILSS